jgi:hypothetical protein
VKYGDALGIGYAGPTGGGWLDVCGGSGCTAGYQVQISSSDNRDSFSGKWTILHATKPVGTCVCEGDNAYFLNGYGSGTYLDTCNPYYVGSTHSGYFVQATNAGKSRDGPSGTWTVRTAQIAPPPPPPAPTCSKTINYYTPLTLENGYGPHSYLFDLQVDTGCAGGRKLATRWLDQTDVAARGVWTFYTWDPTTPKKVLADGTCVKYGDALGIGYAGPTGGGWLDVCGGSGCTAGYQVQISSSDNRDSFSGKWTVLHDTKAIGTCVCENDVAHFVNGYGAGTWLDTCNPYYIGNVHAGYFVQATNAGKSRDGPSGSWAIKRAPDTCKPIKYYTNIILENGYGPHSYLFNLNTDSGCAGGKKLATRWFNVSESDKLGAWKLYTWDPSGTPSKLPTFDGTCVKYGDALNIGWAGSSGGYLDVCGATSCTQGYAVQISASGNRGPYTGKWTPLHDTKPIGSCICEGDTAHFQNAYSSGTYLDTCNPYYTGSNVHSGYYIQSTTQGATRDGPSGSWTVKAAAWQ